MLGLIFKNKAVHLDRTLPEPTPGEGEVRIRMALAGICATDIEISKGYMDYEGILGHEFIGIVDAPHLPDWNGVRVVGGINCPCGACDLCLRGLERHCSSRSVLGILGRDGAFAEHLVLPLNNLAKIPDSLTDEMAVFTEPVAAVLRIPEQTQITNKERVVILGDGRLGLLAAGVGIALGWKVSLVGKHPEKMRIVQGAVTRYAPEEADQGTFDVAIDCTGSPLGIKEACRLLRPEGRLVMKTTIANPGSVDLTPMVINEITLVGSRCGDMKSAVKFLEQGLFDPSVLISARYPLSRGVEAFDEAKKPGSIKVLLEGAA